MFLSKRSNGVYYLWYEDENGSKRKVSTRHKRKSDALKFVNEFKNREREKRIRIKNVSLSKFKDEYLEYSQHNHTAGTKRKHFESAFNEFIRHIGDFPLNSISYKQIETFLSAKRTEASAWTARRCYIALSSAFETARKWGYIRENIFRQIKRPEPPEQRPLFLTKQQFNQLLDGVDDKDFRELIITGVSTGLRLGELVNLEWEHVDLIRRIIDVVNTTEHVTKNKKSRSIPLSEQMHRLLALRKERSVCRYVFHRNLRKYNDEYVSKQFKKFVRKAKLNDKIHFHTLRHTFASWLVQSGVSLYEVQRLLGHSNISTTMVYSHLQVEERHDTVNKIVLEVSDE
jgi:integrase